MQRYPGDIRIVTHRLDNSHYHLRAGWNSQILIAETMFSKKFLVNIREKEREREKAYFAKSRLKDILISIINSIYNFLWFHFVKITIILITSLKKLTLVNDTSSFLKYDVWYLIEILYLFRYKWFQTQIFEINIRDCAMRSHQERQLG